MNILIVEDDVNLNRGISYVMEKEGYEVSSANCLKEAQEHVKNKKIDLIILDLNLPDGDGLNFCASVHTSYDIPVIMLTARDMETDEIIGLEYGAEDYITKPFSLAVLKARVKNILRRRNLNGGSQIIRVKDYVLNNRVMEISKDGHRLDLTLTEYKLLSYFIQNVGTVLTKEQILSAIWDINENYVDENTLAVNIRRLRKKIGKEDDIQTIFGVGYCFAKGAER